MTSGHHARGDRGRGKTVTVKGVAFNRGPESVGVASNLKGKGVGAEGGGGSTIRRVAVM